MGNMCMQPQQAVRARRHYNFKTGDSTDFIPLKDQGKVALFKPTQIMFIRAQNKNYNNLRKFQKFKNVSDLPSTDLDMAGIKRLMKKLGSENAHCEIIDLVDADRSKFKKTMLQAEIWLAEAEELGEKRCLFFYYTGHGFQQNWTQAGLNHEINFKFNMEEKLNSMSKNPNCFVVAIIDCCREDISHLEKNFGARSFI